VGFARLTLAHRPRRLGFRVDVGFGDLTELLFRSDPASLQHPDVSRWLSYFTQTFVSVDLPIGRGLRIDAGKFATPVGYEGNESIANWNYSRGLLYEWAEPSIHTGLAAAYSPSRRIAFSSFVLNGWNVNIPEGAALRSFAVAAVWKPSDALRTTLVYMGGPERDPIQFDIRTSTWRNLLDASVVWTPERRISFVLTGDYGHDAARGGVDWWGVAGYARLDPSGWFDAAVRAELLSDPQGFVTGTAQTVAEVTSTLDVHWLDGQRRIATRLEYRHDQSSAAVFEPASSDPRGRQETLTAALLATF
jgi:hypothetical protein